jgi:lysozyme
MTPADALALKLQLTAHEGRKNYLYDDATGARITQHSVIVGHPTWGIGFDVDATLFCDAAIDAQYDAVLAELIQELTAAVPWAPTLPIGPWRAVIDVAFNVGVHGLLGFHKMLACLQAGNYLNAATELVNSAIAPARAQRLAALMRS